MRFLFWVFLVLLLTVRFFLYFRDKPQYPDGEKVRITDRITSQPIRYTYSQHISLAGFEIYLPLYPEVSYGDNVVVEGTVRGKEIKSPKVVAVEESTNFLFAFREKLLAFYKKALPDPHASLIAGVTLGSKSGIPADFWDALKITGTAHVVVASGMNVTLVAKFLIGFFVLFLPRRRAIPLALTGIWGYSAIAGFDAPIIRAAVMATSTFVAQEAGRLYYAWRTLIITATLMLLIRPDWITDLGFALSFVATSSLMLFERKVNRLIYFVPKFFREGFSTSLAAQIGVAPILFVTFGQFNILSPLINAALLWTIPYMTSLAMIGGVVGLITPVLGKLVLYVVFPLTSWFVFIVHLFG